MNYSLDLKFVLLASLVGSAWAQQNPAAPPLAARVGYLSPVEAPDVSRIIPTAPTTGDFRDASDIAIFRATRSLEGSPRWALALVDNDVSTAGIFRAYSCSLGVALTRENAPLLAALITRATIDGSTAVNKLKQLNQQRKRPFLVEDGPVCLARPTGLEANPDYPSGHTTLGWEVGLILAEAAPDAATAILSRARAFGESRVSCGVHNASAVEAGQITAAAVVAALHGSPAFRADLEVARAELAELRKGAWPKPVGCATEAENLAVHPF